MKTLYNICIGLSLGLLSGGIAGGIKSVCSRKSYSEKKVQSNRRLVNRLASILKYITFMLLILGLICCTYFLILGIFVPGQADYANNMAELVVSVLSVISILFAFVEFLRRKDDKK